MVFDFRVCSPLESFDHVSMCCLLGALADLPFPPFGAVPRSAIIGRGALLCLAVVCSLPSLPSPTSALLRLSHRLRVSCWPRSTLLELGGFPSSCCWSLESWDGRVSAHCLSCLLLLLDSYSWLLLGRCGVRDLLCLGCRPRWVACLFSLWPDLPRVTAWPVS